MGKETTTYNIISWTVEFKKERFARAQTLEAVAATRLPEIHLVNLQQT
jgi:hypothetical protein